MATHNGPRAATTDPILMDWDGNHTMMRIDDQGDSISLVTTFSTGDGSFTMEAGIRLDSTRLDVLQAEINRIRAERGI